MRSVGVRLAFVIGVLVVPTDAWATPGSGSMTRTPTPGGLNIQLTNSGNRDIAADVVLPAGTSAFNVGPLSGVAGSCSPNSSDSRVINCFFDPPDGWPPSTTFSFDFQTNPPLPDNVGAQLFTCDVPCDPNMKDGPYTVTGVPTTPPAASADLSLVVSPFATVSPAAPYQLVAGRQRIWQIVLPVSVGNAGPADAAGVELEMRASNAPSPETQGGIEMNSGPASVCDPLASSFAELALRRCTYGTFPSGATSGGTYRVVMPQTGTVSVTGSVSSPTPDTQLENNSVAFDASIEGVRSLGPNIVRGRVVQGRAPGAPSAFVAVGQERGGARLSEPPGAQGGSSHAVDSAAGCRWLRTARVRFRNESGRRCDEPSYLRAKVKRGRWKIRLRKRLPAGRYVIFSRAVSAEGAIESAVGSKLGNLKRFRVR